MSTAFAGDSAFPDKMIPNGNECSLAGEIFHDASGVRETLSIILITTDGVYILRENACD